MLSLAMTLLQLSESFTLGQVPAPCGNTPEHPCYSVQVSVPSTERFMARSAEEVNAGWACNCAECSTAISMAKTCAAKLEAHQGLFDEMYFVGLMVLIASLGLHGLSRVDKIAAAWRRAEFPARMFVRAAFYWLAAFSGTALAVGLFR